MARKRTEEGKAAGRRIAELRERRRLTQQAAAEMLGVGYRTYQTWESGESVPRWHNRVKLARLYGVDPADILGPVPAPPLEGVQLDRIERKLDWLLQTLTPSTGSQADRLARALLEADTHDPRTIRAAERFAARKQR